ncbi:uncharacterized protein A1O9_09141 [Exophiala aquamarina CBS 119918]|uniref:Major facilitator superfamily (MFS) profile domain-containing protein n=1 Tax=Exophiala aquamarina CBS 119918 TaxID=1182545 RepID=A0A072P3J6_9EURO|nr:uncharacterized protein A1O9_09141 [Exophiala aquamarina CBS 119918]KEF54699.1 hypothetical protein A1O9_09141 [Exophiala aquamarina CBS 119918]
MADKAERPVDEIERTSSPEDVPVDSKLHGEEDWTAEEERKLVRKIDWRILPYLSLVFGLSLLDRSNISAAYIAGMGTDLDLAVGSRYSIALLLFFITYALCEIPSNLIIRRIGARWWLSFLITLWGVSVLCMGFVKSWIPLTILRLLLGIFEAGLFPGSIFIISSWYKTYETARRVSTFYMASLLASGFNGIVRPGLTHLKRWRWIFIIEGAITVACGLLAPIFLGEFPEKTRWLTERQRHIATLRIANERSGREYEHPSLWQGLRMLMDWKVGVYALQYYVAASSVYSLAYFIPIILRQGLGYSYALSQILTSPPYLFTVVMSILTAWLSDKMKLRWPTRTLTRAFRSVVGLLIVLYAKPPGVRLFGTFLAVFGTQANVPGSLAYGQNQTALPQKKGLVAAAMITAGAAGGITGSTIFRAQDAPLYLPGMWVTIVFQILYFFGTMAMSLWFKKRNREADEKGVVLEGVVGFRYAP